MYMLIRFGAGICKTQKSINGLVAMKNGGSASWSLREQEVVAMSLMEANYISMCSGARKICMALKTAGKGEIHLELFRKNF